MLLEIHHTVVMGTTKTPLTSKGELFDLENFKVSSDSKYAFLIDISSIAYTEVLIFNAFR